MRHRKRPTSPASNIEAPAKEILATFAVRLAGGALASGTAIRQALRAPPALDGSRSAGAGAARRYHTGLVFDASFRLKLALLLIAAFLLVPLAIGVATHESSRVPWHQASMAGTGLAPDPAKTLDAVVQVYAAKAFGWRGAFSVHTWIVVKPPGAAQFKRFDVVGWSGSRVVRENYAAADALWYGGHPEILLDLRGQQAEPLIRDIEAAIAAYPFADTYHIWPGPNSNTFTAYIGRNVPDLRLDMPANAIGKDYLPIDSPIARAPSGTGLQISVLGLLGAILAVEEGIEINILGLSAGIDFLHPALRLPGLGRIGMRKGAATD